MKKFKFENLSLCGLLFSMTAAAQQLPITAPDAYSWGSETPIVGEYKLPATVDATVIGDRMTELWAAVYHPQKMQGKKYPLVVILTGNHSTCGRFSATHQVMIEDNSSYTETGRCTTGSTPILSHLGYAYFAERLASHGIVVVSINPNRGINGGSGTSDDRGLNWARGKLVLRHLQALSEWNEHGGAPSSLGIDLKGSLDFSKTGFVGHSMGGEGVRAAFKLYSDTNSPWRSRILSPMKALGITELGGVDGAVTPPVDALNVPWNSIVGLCDVVVPPAMSAKPFRRMMHPQSESNPSPKSMFAIWGANHNFFNTEWKLSDSEDCFGHKPLWNSHGGSLKQQQVTASALLAFFRAHLTGETSFSQYFNPQFSLPASITSVTQVDRSYMDSSDPATSLVFDNFDQKSGYNTHGPANQQGDIDYFHIQGTSFPAEYGWKFAWLSWSNSGPERFFQSNWTDLGTGKDISQFKTLDIFVSRNAWTFNMPGVPTDFSVQLVMSDGSLSSSVPLSECLKLLGPVGGSTGVVPLPQTVRFKLSDFAGADLKKIRGVRLVFDKTETGAIYLGGIRVSTKSGS
jgi:hypothetical protein